MWVDRGTRYLSKCYSGYFSGVTFWWGNYEISSGRTPSLDHSVHIYSYGTSWSTVSSRERESCTAHNSQETETNFMSITGRMGRENAVCIHNGLLFGHKKKNKIPWFAE